VHQGLTPVTVAEKVALRFTMVEHDMGETELVADERAPGEYVAVGSPTAMYGTWKVQAIIRLPGKDDVSALFTVPISQQGGQGATAVALTTKSFSLVVFPDPSLPIAGAPIQLSVIVLENGQPAIGRTITGTPGLRRNATMGEPLRLYKPTSCIMANIHGRGQTIGQI